MQCKETCVHAGVCTDVSQWQCSALTPVNIIDNVRMDLGIHTLAWLYCTIS